MNDERTLREHRQALGILQQKLAELAHVSVSMVALLDCGYRPGRGSTVPAIEHALEQLERSNHPVAA